MTLRGVPFYKLSPGGNTTILVMDAGLVPPAERPGMAVRLMDPLHLGAEQVGFVDLAAAPPRLDMMGGEFCGNAARCLAAVLALEGRLDRRGEIAVSGAPEPLPVRVERRGGLLDAWVRMPAPSRADVVRLLGPGLHAVALGGITHLLLDEAAHPFPADPAAEAARLRREYGLQDLEAAGCVWYARGGGDPAIRPVVWVRATGTTYLETACGSGTVALALLLAREAGGDARVSVLQPSGERIAATVEADPDTGGCREAWIGGPVAVVARGEAFACSSACPEGEKEA